MPLKEIAEMVEVVKARSEADIRNADAGLGLKQRKILDSLIHAFSARVLLDRAVTGFSLINESTQAVWLEEENKWWKRISPDNSVRPF